MMELQDSNRALFRGGLFPSITVSILTLIGASIWRGSDGFFGALLAAFTVVIFFSVSLLVARLTKDANPIATFALALFSYFTKLFLMALFLIAVTHLTSPESVDRKAFGISALAIALAWLAGEVRAFLRLRLQLPLPPN